MFTSPWHCTFELYYFRRLIVLMLIFSNCEHYEGSIQRAYKGRALSVLP